MFRKIFINGMTTTIFAASGVTPVEIKKKDDQEKSTRTKEEINQNDLKTQSKCRPSELPIYEPLHELSNTKKDPKPQSQLYDMIEKNIRFLRLQIQSGYGLISENSKKLEEIIEVGKAHSKETVDYLRNPQNKYQQIGAIAAGGFSGLIYASLRGGFFKKILYTAIGAGGVASICYPEEAKIYSQEALVQTKKGLSIAYNFALGVKPGDEVSYNNPLSKFPTNYDELSDLASDLYKNAKDAFFSTKK